MMPSPHIAITPAIYSSFTALSKYPHFSRGVRVAGKTYITHARALSTTRSMSNSPTKHLFVLHAPDYTDPSALDRRFSVREEHLKGMATLISSGIAKFGGSLLAPELTDENDRKKMTGSLIFFDAESIEEVRKIVESDIYYTSGVWDKEKICILPFMPAMRWPSN